MLEAFSDLQLASKNLSLCLCSICMYHMHDNFGKRTELLMHELADATSGALRMSSGILGALDGMDTKMQGKLSSALLQNSKHANSLSACALYLGQPMRSQESAG